MTVAIILAGGTGLRVGADRPKQFIEVLGKPIIAYTLRIYEEFSGVDAVEVVCHRQWTEYLEQTVRAHKLTKVHWVTDGGNTFQESVMNGMERLHGVLSSDDIVMLHYAAAPFTSAKILEDALRVCHEHGSAVSCTPCYQLMGTHDGDESHAWVDRDRLVQLACPQCFRFSYLLDIYRRAKERGLLASTEPHTTSLMYALGDTVHQSYGDQTNIKITTAADIRFFEAYARGMKNIDKKRDGETHG